MSRSPDNTGLDLAADLDFEQILTNPILDIAARVWHPERYRAFRLCYRSMRVIDDLVDQRKEEGSPITDRERELYRTKLDDWLDSMEQGKRLSDVQSRLLDVLEEFSIPLWPWRHLRNAMVYDLYHDGFATWRTFRKYAEGAAVAPASIFIHLCGVEHTDGTWRAPGFDIRSEARNLALFSYVVHILRDFQKDQLSGLTYFADNILNRYDLSREDLRRFAEENNSDSRLCRLVGFYRKIAGRYRARARSRLDALTPDLEKRCGISLELIYALYSQVYERVIPDSGDFSGERLQPSPDEIKACIEATLTSFSGAQF
jgi:phytoene synthase